VQETGNSDSEGSGSDSDCFITNYGVRGAVASPLGGFLRLFLIHEQKCSMRSMRSMRGGVFSINCACKLYWFYYVPGVSDANSAMQQPGH
jgi:hypothetical protein